MISLRTRLELGAAIAVLVAIPLADHRGYERGMRDEQVAQEGRNAVAYTEAQRKTTKASDASAKIGEKVEEAKVGVRTITQTLTREVVRYVPAAADAQCVVPVGFVRLHNAAATGVLSNPADPAGQSADAASGVALSAVGATVVYNYGACREDREALKGWQAWYADVSPQFKGEGQ